MIVLDVGLPGFDGTEVCRRLRAAGDWTPVLFVTARDDEVDRVFGLELGADDYVTKPFSPRELAALGAAAAAALLTFTTVTGAAAVTGGDSTSSAGVPGERWRPGRRVISPRPAGAAPTAGCPPSPAG